MPIIAINILCVIAETWTVEELSNVLQMPATALRRKIAYWQTQGLLREEATDKFVLVEEHKGRAMHDIIVTDDDEAESAMASAQTQREEELQVHVKKILLGGCVSGGVVLRQGFVLGSFKIKILVEHFIFFFFYHNICYRIVNFIMSNQGSLIFYVQIYILYILYIIYNIQFCKYTTVKEKGKSCTTSVNSEF